MQKNFFDYYPELIFSPLAGPNKRLYLNILMSIYEQFFGETAELDDVSLPAVQLRNHIESSIVANTIWIDEQSGDKIIIDASQLKSKSNYIYNRFVDTGWVREELRGHKTYVFMSPKITELIEYLSSAGQNLSKFVGGYVITIYQGLRSIVKLEDDASIAFILDKAYEDSITMGRRMNNLAMQIREVTDKLSEFTDTTKKADTFFNDFVSQSTFSDYNDIKKADHPFRFKTDILSFLIEIEYNENVRARVLAALSSREQYSDAEQDLNKYVSTIRRIFTNTDHLLSKVDTTHAKLVVRVNEAIRYRRRTGSNMNSLIGLCLSKLNSQPNVEGLELISLSPDINGLSQDFMYEPKRKRAPIKKDTGTLRKEVSPYTLIRNELHREYLRSMKVSDAKLLHWLDGQLSENKQLESQSIKVDTPNDFAMFVQILRLCVDTHYFAEKYRKTLNVYSFTSVGQEAVEHDAFYCVPFHIVRLASSNKGG